VPFLGQSFDLTFRNDEQKRMINFYYGPHNVFCLLQYLDGGICRSVPYSFTFYGTYFALPDIQGCLVAFLDWNIPLAVSRVDIAVDTNVPTESLWKWKNTQFRKNNVYRDGESIETFYLGQKQNNKKFFIRVYNKKLDSLNKGKIFLFHQYLAEETVTRIEAQINILTVKALDITRDKISRYAQATIAGDESGLSILEEWFSALCMNEQGTYFYNLKGVQMSKSERLLSTKFTGRSSYVERSRYVKVFLSYAKRLHGFGMDVRGLIDEHVPPFGTGSNSADFSSQEK
jgi:hypothetical protein